MWDNLKQKWTKINELSLGPTSGFMSVITLFNRCGLFWVFSIAIQSICLSLLSLSNLSCLFELHWKAYWRRKKWFSNIGAFFFWQNCILKCRKTSRRTLHTSYKCIQFLCILSCYLCCQIALKNYVSITEAVTSPSLIFL